MEGPFPNGRWDKGQVGRPAGTKRPVIAGRLPSRRPPCSRSCSRRHLAWRRVGQDCFRTVHFVNSVHKIVFRRIVLFVCCHKEENCATCASFLGDDSFSPCAHVCEASMKFPTSFIRLHVNYTHRCVSEFSESC